MPNLQLGLSPCPNDTFIFHALLHGLVELDHSQVTGFEPVFADVQELNLRALAGALPFTKISAGVIPKILDNYTILSSGAALGWGCGPLLVARDRNFDPANASIAIPGRHTTAALLLNLHGVFQGPRKEMLFSDIIPAVASGDVDLGVIIHEGRFTYQRNGLISVLDFGQWWENEFQLPLPLGVIAARRDVAPDLAYAVEKAIAASIKYAHKNPAASEGFIRQHAQELDENVTRSHIDTFVSEYSVALGPRGRDALRRLIGANGSTCGESRIFASE